MARQCWDYVDEEIVSSEGFLLFQHHPAERFGDGSLADRGPQDQAELIVTLHRTIDAQLAILRGARSDINAYGGKPASWPAANYLADAILGAGS